MCAITALVVKDYLGGMIGKIYVDGVSHYFNIIDGKIIDLTASQFNHPVDYSTHEIVDGEVLLNENTRLRYNMLKSRLERLLR